ncbi:MAG: hypothetical protein GY751_24035 [Bacteroidetes bacterium]|nr:hypothetical protein [Bacteroidota bacterium]
MRALFTGIILLLYSLVIWAGNAAPPMDIPPASIEKSVISPCVKTLLDGEPIVTENGLNKDSEGTLHVELDEENKIYFNLVLKSNVGENEPPLYLRFIKVDRLDIQKVLRYANIGDEIFIEPFSRDGFKCLPSHFVVT